MGKASTIKWRKSDAKRISNLVRQVNSKITRVEKKGGVNAKAQPQRLNSKLLQEELKGMNRQQFNRIVRKYDRYLKRGAETAITTAAGVNTTIWQKKEISNEIRTINQYKAREIKKYQPSPYKGNMGTIEYNNLLPRKNTSDNIPKRDWDIYVKQLEGAFLAQGSPVKKELYKDNILRAISSELGTGRVWEEVAAIPVDDLYDLFYTSRVLNIDFVYDPKEAEEREDYILDEISALKGQYKPVEGEYIYLKNRSNYKPHPTSKYRGRK